MKNVFIVVLSLFLIACSAEKKNEKVENVIALTKATFEAEVIKSEGLVVVDFWAAWCGPCRIIKPYLNDLANEYAGQVKVTSVDVDKNIDIARQYNIQNIPAVFFFKNGEIVQKVIGVRSKAEFSSLFDKYL